MGVSVKSDALRELIDENAEVEKVATGFTFTEGPIWNAVEQCLFFSDMPGDVRRCWSEEGIREVMNPSNKCNGLTYDLEGNLLVCEHITSSLVREKPDGTRETIASHFEGKELNSPNDVTVRSDGTIYFSDPWYGRFPGFGIERARELGWQGVFRIPPGPVTQMLPRSSHFIPSGMPSSITPEPTPSKNMRPFEMFPSPSAS